MSIQNTTAVNHFNRTPDDLFRPVLAQIKSKENSYSQAEVEADKAVVKTTIVCKNWQNSPALNKERVMAAMRLYQQIVIQCHYPQAIVHLFKNCNVSIGRLPVLDVSTNVIEPDDMTNAIMRFQDGYGRLGLALKIRASDQARNRIEDWMPAQEFVLLFFRSVSTPAFNLWTHGWGNGDEMLPLLYQTRHLETNHEGSIMTTCPHCPFANGYVHPMVLISLLTVQDPDFSLPGHSR